MEDREKTLIGVIDHMTRALIAVADQRDQLVRDLAAQLDDATRLAVVTYSKTGAGKASFSRGVELAATWPGIHRTRGGAPDTTCAVAWSQDHNERCGLLAGHTGSHISWPGGFHFAITETVLDSSLCECERWQYGIEVCPVHGTAKNRCGAVAIPCLWGEVSCPRDAHEHEPCTLPYPHEGRHSWQVEPYDNRDATDPHKPVPVTYALPAPPPRGREVTNGEQVWTHLDHTGDGSYFRDLAAVPAVTSIPWANLLDQYGPLTLVEEDQADAAMYGPIGARWGRPEIPCPFTLYGDDDAPSSATQCALGLNHAGPHRDQAGAALDESDADGSRISAGISPHEASKTPCTCGHPDAHKPGCPRYTRVSGVGPVIDVRDHDGEAFTDERPF